jgi:hypothetical protein
LAGHKLLNLSLASIKLSSRIAFVSCVYGFIFLYVGQLVLLAFVERCCLARGEPKNMVGGLFIVYFFIWYFAVWNDCF